MADLSLDLCGVKLKNPIIAASGTFGFGREYDELYDIGQLGGISVKGLSLLPRTGNPPSRIAETPSGMLNSVGLQNPGVESFIENDLPWLLTKDVAVIANITGTSVEQYVQMAERLAGTGVHLLEMNISCPNVHEGGVAFGVKPESVYAITKAVKAAARQPLIVKLTPNVSDITENALAAEEAGADAISMINTLTGIAGCEQAQDGAGKQHGRPFRPGGAPGRPAHGLAERQEGAYSDHRHGRYRDRRGRGGVHALRREGRHGRHGEFHRSVRLPAHRSGAGRILRPAEGAARAGTGRDAGGILSITGAFAHKNNPRRSSAARVVLLRAYSI